MQTVTIQDRAREASAWFERATRPNGDEFIRLKDERPEWLYELVREAHSGSAGNMLPDDWRYACIEAAVNAIADASDDPDDAGSEFADSYVDIYNAARFAWLASHIQRQFYCDEATEVFGPAESVTDTIGRGQYLEAREVFESVRSSLEALEADDEGV